MAKKILSALQTLKDTPFSSPPNYKNIWGIVQLCVQPIQEVSSVENWKKHRFKILAFSFLGLFIIHKLKSFIPREKPPIFEEKAHVPSKGEVWMKFSPLSHLDLKSEEKALVRADTSPQVKASETSLSSLLDEKKLEESISDSMEQVQKYRYQLSCEKERKRLEAEQACQRVKDILSKPLSIKSFLHGKKL